jgi:hypothetical protein
MLQAKLIVETVARYRLPAIYVNEVFMAEGGLMHYYSDPSDRSGSHPSMSIASSGAPKRAICQCTTDQIQARHQP